MHVAHTQEAATIFYLNFKTLLGHHAKVSVFELRGGGGHFEVEISWHNWKFSEKTWHN